MVDCCELNGNFSTYGGRNFRSNTKKNLQEIRQHQNRTGGGQPCNIVLSDLEEKIVAICGKDSLDGDSNIDEAGFGPRAQPC